MHNAVRFQKNDVKVKQCQLPCRPEYLIYIRSLNYDVYTFFQIGHLYFDANNGSVNDSYTGLPLNSPGGLNWVAGLTLLPETDEVDTHLYKRFSGRWNQLKHKNT